MKWRTHLIDLVFIVNRAALLNRQHLLSELAVLRTLQQLSFCSLLAATPETASVSVALRVVVCTGDAHNDAVRSLTLTCAPVEDVWHN